MTEEHQFQAPPAPPKAPSFGGPAPAFPSVSAHADSAEVPPNNFAVALKISPRIFETKFMLAIFGVCIFIGLALGALFFGGSSAPVVQMPRDAIRGVIENPDIRQKLTRCGMVPPSSACLVYLVNHTPDDHYAEYFFETASQLTGRAPFRIRIDNQKYAKTRIPPGYIAKIIIPRR